LWHENQNDINITSDLDTIGDHKITSDNEITNDHKITSDPYIALDSLCSLLTMKSLVIFLITRDLFMITSHLKITCKYGITSYPIITCDIL